MTSDEQESVQVTILDRRRESSRRSGDSDHLATCQVGSPLTAGQTIELTDETMVVVLGIRDVLSASGHSGWDQVAFVGNYEALLDPSTPTIKLGQESQEPMLVG
jgi:hypothetical protein